MLPSLMISVLYLIKYLDLLIENMLIIILRDYFYLKSPRRKKTNEKN